MNGRGPTQRGLHHGLLALVALGLAALVLVLAWPREAAAHGRDTSHSRWHLSGEDVEVALRISARDRSRFLDAETLAATLELDRCARSDEVIIEEPGARGDRILRWSYTCAPGPAPPQLRVGLFEILGPAHVHVLALDGTEADERILTSATPSTSLAAATPGPRGLFAFVGLGASHILEGWDHLAFVATLLIGAAALGEVAVLITGFTIGHSLTLALAALGLARPEPSSIELLIAASVVVVAADELRRRGQGQRPMAEQVGAVLLVCALIATLGGQACALAAWGAALLAWGYLRREPSEAPGRGRLVLVAGFGLVHGAGFAGVLQEAGLPPGARASSLLGFNLGVELGQLAFVLLVWPALVWLRRARPGADTWLGLGLLALGVGWVAARALGA